jgi:peptidoglycan/xylan/chitin deacetylase (PgdA/CDA1 family)
VIARSFRVLVSLAVAATAHADKRTVPTPAVMGAAKKSDVTSKTDVKSKTNVKSKVKVKSEDEKLLELTNDPLLGNADRISGEEARGFVTFTFDDGPNPGTTDAVVDALENYNIPAMFFIVTRRLLGKHGEESRALLARILEKGFLVASHSVSHPNLRGASPKKLAAEIDQSIRTLSKAAERPIGMFRAPFGAIDARGRGWLKKRGLTEAFWSIDTLDWQAKNAERLRTKIFKMILEQDGGVVLMHDVKQITAEVVASVLDDLEAENCRRLEAQRRPIWPVSIHYFLRDKKKRRPIPEAVKKTTEGYQLALPLRCAARPKPTPDLLRPLFLE